MPPLPFELRGECVDKLLRGDDMIPVTGEDKKGYQLNKINSKRFLSKNVILQQDTNHLEKHVRESRN